VGEAIVSYIVEDYFPFQRLKWSLKLAKEERMQDKVQVYSPGNDTTLTLYASTADVFKSNYKVTQRAKVLSILTYYTSRQNNIIAYFFYCTINILKM
jgi:hypothetical protein